MAQISSHHSLLKRTLRFLISMSLVSLFLFFSLYQNSSFNLVYHLFPFFSHTLERKYMFLICNGILVILAKGSVSAGSSSSEDGVMQPLTPDLYASKSAATDQDVALDIYTEESQDDGALEAPEEQLQEENSMEVLTEEGAEEVSEEEEENESSLYVPEDESGSIFEVQQQEENSKESLTEEVAEADDEEDEEEEEEVIESNEDLTSTEEMNRRFEEFIRKMKEEIRIEAQTQLVAAV